MATTSIMKNIEINTQEQCCKFISALEHSLKNGDKNISPDISCREIKGAEIRTLFKE